MPRRRVCLEQATRRSYCFGEKTRRGVLVFTADEDLAAYAGDYLKEEIAAEAAVRNVGAFSRFLEVAAHAHGQMINFASMANDAQVPASTVREYYQILKDTFLAHEVPAYTETRKRKAISTSKISTRWPRTFTWRSLRPRYSRHSSGRSRPRSPVR